jgi:Spy/CpxP family protein refolding chaperone
MKNKNLEMLLLSGFLCAACFASPAALRAQAPPGPLPGAPSQPSTQPKTQPPAERPPRQAHDFAGSWKLNPDESDDIRKKMQEARENRGGSGGGTSGGRRGGGYPGGGLGGHSGRGGGRQGGESDENRQRMRQLFLPANSLTIAQKENELDFTDDLGQKQAFYTDGRKIEKSKDSKNLEASARWDSTRLVSEEKAPNGGKLVRTFELSPEGDQLYETLKMGNDRSDFPITIRYVYDLVPPPKP